MQIGCIYSTNYGLIGIASHLEVERLGSSLPSATTWHTAHATHSSTLEEHLEDIIRIHSAHATSSTTLINLLDIGALVVHLSLLLVGEDTKGLADVLKLCLSLGFLLFRGVGVLVGVPLDRSLFVRFLHVCLARVFRHAQDRIVVLALALLDLELCLA